MDNYIDINYKVGFGKTKYKLFAVNILEENNNGDIDYNYEVERDGNWYQMNNNQKTIIKHPINYPNYFNYSCGLFYKMCKILLIKYF